MSPDESAEIAATDWEAVAHDWWSSRFDAGIRAAEREAASVERDLRRRIDELTAERDRAREECGHEKAMRAGQYKELMYHVGYLRDARAERDAALAAAPSVSGSAPVQGPGAEPVRDETQR